MATPQPSSELLAQGFPFVRVGSYPADSGVRARCGGAAAPEWRIELEIRLYRDRAPTGKAAEEFWAAVADAYK